VLDEKDLWVFLRRRIRDLRLKHFVRAANVGQFLDSLLEFMRRCQDELVGPAEYARYVERIERGEVPLPRVARSKKHAEMEDVEILERCQEIARVFTTVEDMLREKNLGTFGHMITNAYQLLKDDPALLEKERLGTRFLLVDEIPGCEFLPRSKFLSLLAGPERMFLSWAIRTRRSISSVAPRAKRSRCLLRNFLGRESWPWKESAFAHADPALALLALWRRTLRYSRKPASSISYQRAPLASLRDEEAEHRGDGTAAPLVEIVTWVDREVEAADVAYRMQKKRKGQPLQVERFCGALSPA